MLTLGRVRQVAAWGEVCLLFSSYYWSVRRDGVGADQLAATWIAASPLCRSLGPITVARPPLLHRPGDECRDSGRAARRRSGVARSAGVTVVYARLMPCQRTAKPREIAARHLASRFSLHINSFRRRQSVC